MLRNPTNLAQDRLGLFWPPKSTSSGRTWLGIDQPLPGNGQIWPESPRSEFDQLRTTWPGVDQIRSNFGRCWAEIDRVRPSTPSIFQNWCGIHQTWPNIVQFCLDSANFGQNSTNIDKTWLDTGVIVAIWPGIHQIFSEFDQLRITGPESTRFGTISADVGPNSTDLYRQLPESSKIGPGSTKLGPASANFGPIVTNYGHIWTGFDQLWPEF